MNYHGTILLVGAPFTNISALFAHKLHSFSDKNHQSRLPYTGPVCYFSLKSMVRSQSLRWLVSIPASHHFPLRKYDLLNNYPWRTWLVSRLIVREYNLSTIRDRRNFKKTFHRAQLADPPSIQDREWLVINLASKVFSKGEFVIYMATTCTQPTVSSGMCAIDQSFFRRTCLIAVSV